MERKYPVTDEYVWGGWGEREERRIRNYIHSSVVGSAPTIKALTGNGSLAAGGQGV